jgi:dTDP-4-dehydrorhamnose reductase
MMNNNKKAKPLNINTSKPLVLVTGANGMLGQDLCPILEDEGYEVVETDINTLDITNSDMVKKVLSEQKPDIVVHCAAYTNVDKAEEDYDTAHKINAVGTENLAKACAQNDITLVYISTDYVFQGNGAKPYKPTDETSPLNNYGLTKYEGEQAVQKYCKKFYICRTAWLYGIHGKNFVETMIALAEVKPESTCSSKSSRAEHNTTAVTTEAEAKEVKQSLIAQADKIALADVKPELKVVDDQTGCPTWTVDLSNAIVKILEESMPYGIYHTCGGGSTSWYGFAKEIFKLANLDVNLLPCATEEFPRPAKRPKYSVMDNGGLCRPWQKALADYMALR